MMNTDFAARCGINCGKCEYREQMNCPGCMKADGKIFWGTCPVATCNIEKAHQHCGECQSFVCDTLHGFAYDQEQGDNGQRIENLKARNAEGTENWLRKQG